MIVIAGYMKKLKELINHVLLIKEGEASSLIHFWFIFMLTLGIGLAIGRASADALFLARYGIEYLPVIYIALAPMLALVSIFYAALVDYFPSEKFFRLILFLLIISIVVSWYLMSQTDNTLIYPVYFLIHKIASELLLVHGTLYLAHNFNTLQAKRLFPLIFTGEQLGCIIGGLLVSASSSFIETENMPILWVLLMAIGIIQLSIWHTRHGTSPYFQKQRKTDSRFNAAMRSVYQGLTFTRESPLLRNASFALFFLVIIYYILSYSTNRIFVSVLQDEQDLAEFLGLLTAVTSIITLSIQLFITNRLIDRYGVKRLNLAFPVITASATFALLVSFTLSFAVVVSVLRDSILNSVQNPLRVLFFNALPNYMQGRARAVSIAFVMPVALLICGLLLWGMQKLDNIAYFLIPCFLLALTFLYYSHRMNETYTQALVSQLKERLYLPQTESDQLKLDLNEDALNALQTTFTKLPQARSLTVSLLATHYPEKSVSFVIPRLNELSASDIDIFLHSLFKSSDRPLSYSTLKQFPLKDFHLQATLLKLITDKGYPEATAMALNNLKSTSSRVRAISAYTILKQHDSSHMEAINIWRELLTGSKSDQLSSLVLTTLIDSLDESQIDDISSSVKQCVENLITDKDTSIVSRTIKQLPDHLDIIDSSIAFNCMKNLSSHVEPHIRETSIQGLKLLDKTHKYEIIYDLLNDSHETIRHKALSTLDLHTDDHDTAINKWLMSGASSPRVQSVILEKVIQEELMSHDNLKDMAMKKACEANNYAIARNIIITNNKDLSPDEILLSIVLSERQIQLIDLTLQAMTPLCPENQIAVIRAGLVSKQTQHIANACEVLNNIENIPAADIIKHQLDNKIVTTSNQPKIKLIDTNDVILWAGNLSDNWVKHIANMIKGTAMNENNTRSIIERITLLKQTDIFSEVPTDDLVFVAKELEDLKFFDGDRVFDINDSGDRMYFIVSGQIGISISSDPTEKDFIITLGSGSSFGEMNLLDNMPRSATAHVVGDTSLLSLEKAKLLGLLKSYPELALGILRALSIKVRENHVRNKELKQELEAND